MRNFSVYPLKLSRIGHEMDSYAAVFADWEEATCYLTGSGQAAIRFIQSAGETMEEIRPQFYIGERDLPMGIPCIHRNAERIAADISAGKARILCVDTEYDSYKENELYWEHRGAYRNEQFFQDEVFLPVWEVYRRDFLSLDRIEIFLTSRCTLNCEKCLHFIPYLSNRNDTPLDWIRQDADLLFAKVDHVKKIKLLGGEVFLYPYLKEYLLYLHENYGAQIGEIRLGTNGTVRPARDLLAVCKACATIVDISDYSSAVPERCKLDDAKQYFESYGLRVDIKRTGEKWLDLGFPVSLPPPRTEAEHQRHYQDCAMFCRQFFNGKLYFCCSNYAAVRAGMFPDHPNDCFDFRKVFAKRELLEFELGFNSKGYLTFCEVCRGGSEKANPYQVEVAKQADRHVVLHTQKESV